MKPFMALAALALLLLSRPAAAVDDPFAKWTFDAGNGADVSGNALDVNVHPGVTFVAGRAGLSARLDGSINGFLDHAANAMFEPGTDSWTIYAWVLVKPKPGSIQAVVSWYRCGANGGCSTPDAAYYQMYVNATGRPLFDMRDDIARELTTTGPTPVTDARWHQLVGTFDTATDHATLYVDGVAVDDTSSAMGSLSAGPVVIPLTIGDIFRQGWGSPGEFLVGTVDDVRLYRRALSAAEVMGLYQAGVVGLEARWATRLTLAPAFPSPTRGASSVRASLPVAGIATVAVYDVAGRRIRGLFRGAHDAGDWVLTWDGRDDAGRVTRAGLYSIRFELQGEDGSMEVGSSRVTRLR